MTTCGNQAENRRARRWIKGSPPSVSRALLRPIRLERPPARMTPQASSFTPTKYLTSRSSLRRAARGEPMAEDRQGRALRIGGCGPADQLLHRFAVAHGQGRLHACYDQGLGLPRRGVGLWRVGAGQLYRLPGVGEGILGAPSASLNRARAAITSAFWAAEARSQAVFRAYSACRSRPRPRKA